MTTHPRTLNAYPCPSGGMCSAECRALLDKCTDVTCRWLPIYRQAMADHRCARLLRVFEKRWADECQLGLDWAYSEGASDGYHDGHFQELRDAIRTALRDAGLE